MDFLLSYTIFVNIIFYLYILNATSMDWYFLISKNEEINSFIESFISKFFHPKQN